MQIKGFMKLFAGAFVALSAFSLPAFAATDTYPGPVLGYGAGCAQQPTSPQSCHQEECCNPAPHLGVAYNPEGYFTCKDNCSSNSFSDSLRFRADFLWWRAQEDCLTLGTNEGLTIYPEGKRDRKSINKAPDFNYDPGFRLGLSSVCPCDCWDFALNWTHFHSKATVNGKTEIQDPYNYTFFVPDWQALPLPFPEFAKGKWSLEMDLLDLEFGRKFYVSNCFILRPHFGLRGARIDQGFRVHSVANYLTLGGMGEELNVGQPLSADPLLQGSYISNTHAKNNFLSVGPRLGLDLELALPCLCNFKLFGQAAASLLFGRFERHAKEEFEVLSNNLGPFDQIDYKAHITKKRSSSLATDLAIGVKWEHCCNWCNRSHPITLAVSWELHQFTDLNNFIFRRGQGPGFSPRSLDCGGNLSTQGLTVSSEIGF